jgi:A/G-specific adenine glycosylase
MDDQRAQAFQNYIHRWYTKHGRFHLPWRQDFDPYKIMVSEIMLQQTQVDRVIPKFNQFLESFPTVEKLAKASTADVLKHWQGLGYNRRALNLQKAAQVIVGEWGGQMPRLKEELLHLPGIGPYTSSAISTFAFNQPEIVIETNIRTIFIYHFFPGETEVEDSQLEPLIKKTLDYNHPRNWYAALMDYGTYLKKVLPNPTRRSKQYAKQSKFKGSNRQLRGAILRQLSQQDQTPLQLQETLPEKNLFSADKIRAAIETLTKEGFIEQKNTKIQLAEK